MLTGSFVADSPAPRPAPVWRDSRNRREPRTAHRAPCRVLIPGSGDSFIGLTINLSRTGVAIQIGTPLAIGTDVQLTLPGLDRPHHLVPGRVIHQRRVMTGTFELGIALQEA